ncbi:MAG: hypothetical protein QXT19_05175, partial [Candidatus Woesearchaeota archaeon]
MRGYMRSVSGLVVGWIARLLYIASLTSLVPFGALLLTSAPAQVPVRLGYLPVTALALFGLSALLLLCYHRSLARTLSSLGWMTLLPGLVALFFIIFRRDRGFGMLSWLVVGFGKIEPALNAYLERTLPKLWVFIVGYIIIGFVLVYFAGKIEKERTLTSYLKRLFGPR